MNRFGLSLSLILAFLVVATLAAQTPPAGGGTAPQPAPIASNPAPPPPTKPPQPPPTLRQVVANYPLGTGVFVLAAVVLLAGGGVVLYRAGRNPQNPIILTLGPSFFFWLGMGSVGRLLLMAVAYCVLYPRPQPYLFGGLLPIAVPWFGALGAVTISLEGVFLWPLQWDKKYNYWHLGRPLFGAVLGIVAVFLFVVVVAASGTAPSFLNAPTSSASPAEPPPKDFIIYYVVAFLVGYREETFRELIKRVTDLILKPSPQGATPAVTFEGAAVSASGVTMAATAVGQTSQVVVEVKNSGGAALIAPAVVVGPTAPTPAGTFGTANDQVTGGGDLAPGQGRTVAVTFTPPAVGPFSGVLTVTATNLPAARTIQISGTGQ